MLTTLDHLPPDLLSLEASQLHQILPGPTLIHLPGRRTPPLFVSVLLHGNETTGWLAIRQLLRDHQGQGQDLPRSLSLLIGNVAAARHGLRHLDDQVDFNRIWTGGDRPEHQMAAQVMDQIRRRGAFASIDVHNNSGRNPHYACISQILPSTLHLAELFGRIVVYITRPQGLQAMAFAPLCPALVVECGLPQDPHGVAHAQEYLRACLHLDHIPTRPVLTQDIDLFHTTAVVKIPSHISYGFHSDDVDIRLIPDLDRLNFQELPPYTALGRVRNGWQLDARNDSGEEVSQRYFQTHQGQICTKVPVMPAMLTLDERIIRQDCLCYLMERCPFPPELTQAP